MPEWNMRLLMLRRIDDFPSKQTPKQTTKMKNKPKMKREPKIEFYQDRNAEWRWTITASNGRTVGASTEGFKRLKTAEKNLDLVKDAISSQWPDNAQTTKS